MRQPSIAAAIALLPAVSACGGGGLASDEAQQVFQVMYMVSTSISAESAQRVTTPSAAEPSATGWAVEQDGDDYSFAATISGTGLWTGTIELVGSLTMSADEYEYEYDMVFTDVESGGVILNGVTGMSLYMMTAADGSMEQRYHMFGDMVATGAVSGTASLDYSMDLSYDAATGEYVYAYSGDLGGQDVSGMYGSGSGMEYGVGY